MFLVAFSNGSSDLYYQFPEHNGKIRTKLCLPLHLLMRSSQGANSGIIHSPSPGSCSVNESLLLVWVPLTLPSGGTMSEAPSAPSSPRGEEGAFQSPAAPTGVTIHHQPSTSSLLLITALGFSFPPFLLAPSTFRSFCVPPIPPSLSDLSCCLLEAKHTQG